MSLTVQQVLDRLIEPVGLLERTVDTLKCGRPDAEVRKVAVVMTATYSAIEQAIREGVDLIVTHEPTYFNHLDEHDWIADDLVLLKKRELIEQSGIAIFRFHDYIHRYRPDGILAGMLRKLEWVEYLSADERNLLIFPSERNFTVRSIVTHLKDKLGLKGMMVVGDPELPVSRVGLMPGASGGKSHMNYLNSKEIDLLIVGETNEWETNEYVRDAADMGLRKALIVTGHQKSEEAGMQYAQEQLKAAFPKLEVIYLECPTAGQLL
ncbi:Nif3-like dinuclear metal center hexameric protein [Paenibacillus koleovorans]|uniref:Nif3-like dinuclear metal center hexameric protein n=1 Tax=Paenibacillus koleovorans TaxID=121608 RepID=UPI000FDC30D0|nr:Nif3-like dinuclear metal center hexameric protein [Paenibacillus koleovorans]